LLASLGYQARIDFVSRKILQIPFARRRGNGPQQVLLLALSVISLLRSDSVAFGWIVLQNSVTFSVEVAFCRFFILP
jgi:hypothetical protein